MDALQKIAGFVRDPSVTIDTSAFMFALLVSLLASFYVSFLYRYFYEDRATGSQIHRAFILLGPSITALFIAIQFSLPLSLGLLGALSIIRFRTPIKEPEEIGFIMLLCACSVVTATFKLLLLFGLLVAVTLGLVLKSQFPSLFFGRRRDGIALISLAPGSPQESANAVRENLAGAVSRCKLESVSQRENETILQFSFTDLDTTRVFEVQNELTEQAAVMSVNLYFNRNSSAA